MSLNTSVLGLSSSALGGIASPPTGGGTVACPSCGGSIAAARTETGWQSCPYCEKRLQIRTWALANPSANAAAATPDQATCFFHPEKAYQACCQRCGRFVCALCDLQLGKEHVCPTCFERGRADAAPGVQQAEWRHRDVLYDSIAVTLGWLWFLVWPVIVAAFPAAIFLHIKYRKAPRSYLIPRSGWRFWVAYVGFAWFPLVIFALVYTTRLARRH
ncbi:MAG TPA: hypothetical protein VN661_06260 [Candidatus Acidoferrales bacterium]|nr:hypothetical protein [Candidatus Acidoferrales bacterium]